MEMRWNARRPMGLTGLPAEALPGAAGTSAWPGCSVGPPIDGLEPAGVF